LNIGWEEDCRGHLLRVEIQLWKNTNAQAADRVSARV
jgi:hypothetical protein